MRFFHAMSPLRKKKAPPARPVHLIYELSGEVGAVDVFTLAPALLSLGQLIQESNATLNPGGDTVVVEVRPFREGSFIVDLVLNPATAYAPQLAMAAGGGIWETLKAIGLVASTTK